MHILLQSVLWGDRAGAAAIRITDAANKTVTELKTEAAAILIGPLTPRQANLLQLYDVTDDNVLLTDSRLDAPDLGNVEQVFPNAKLLGPFQTVDEIFQEPSAKDRVRLLAVCPEDLHSILTLNVDQTQPPPYRLPTLTSTTSIRSSPQPRAPTAPGPTDEKQLRQNTEFVYDLPDDSSGSPNISTPSAGRGSMALNGALRSGVAGNTKASGRPISVAQDAETQKDGRFANLSKRKRLLIIIAAVLILIIIIAVAAYFGTHHKSGDTGSNPSTTPSPSNPSSGVPPLHTFTSSGPIAKLTISSDGSNIFSTTTSPTNFTITQWSITSGAVVRTYTTHTARVNVLLPDPRSSRLITGDSSGVTISWDTTTGSQQWVLPNTDPIVTSNRTSIDTLALSQNGTQLFMGVQDTGQNTNKSILFYDIPNHTYWTGWGFNGPTYIASAPYNSTHYIYGTSDGNVILTEIGGSRTQMPFPNTTATPLTHEPIYQLVANGTALIGTYHNTIVSFAWPEGVGLGHPGWYTAWHPPNVTSLSASNSTSPTPKMDYPLLVYNYATNYIFGAGSDGSVRRWKYWDDGEEEVYKEGGSVGVTSLVVTDDGRFVGCGGGDGSIWVWKVQ
ncbi:hypothetical protein HDV00_008528 [Rhizophlyctis rosea]|nr:hypothetical protein HDV00_008528 [Rhizophlyctis rosea]